MNPRTPKGLALMEIIVEARRERSTKAGLRRMRAAARALGMAADEVWDLELLLEYRDHNGDLYPRFAGWQDKNFQESR